MRKVFVKALSVVAVAAVGLLAGASSVMAAVESNAVVNAEWVTQNAENPKVRLIEVSVEPGVYEQGHIPGAANVVWHTDLVDTVSRDIVSAEKFAELASRLGITEDTTVVLYGDNNNWFAAWGAWIFAVHGHNDVRILDGGRKKWELDKRPFITDAPVISPTKYEVKNGNPHLRARLNDVLKNVNGEEDGVLLDIRSPDEYNGKIFAPKGVQELAIRAGHIPGARNVPWSQAVNAEDGTFKSKEELKALYADAGVDGSKPVIVYCRIGERSSHTWFVLTNILGYDVRQYDGSWTEYGNAVGVPIENPAGTVWTGK